MRSDLQFALVALSAVFFVIDPLANVPLFLTITSSHTAEQKRRVARRAAFATWLILCIFALAGGVIFQYRWRHHADVDVDRHDASAHIGNQNDGGRTR